jgi:hypothetical protein
MAPRARVRLGVELGTIACWHTFMAPNAQREEPFVLLVGKALGLLQRSIHRPCASGSEGECEHGSCQYSAPPDDL